MRIAIVINSERMTPELQAKLDSKELTEKHDITYDLFVVKPNELETCLQKLNYETYNACLVGGGDGTVCTAARILAPVQLALAILPLGTLNVLAKSLEHPNDIDAIFGIIKNNKTKLIDVGEVNGVLFINHAWLGSYYYIMKMREKHKEVLGKSKILKAISNIFWMFKRFPIYEFKIESDEYKGTYKTCLIFISTNESSSSPFHFGTRALLSTGLLDVNILNCHTRMQLLKCMFTVIFTRFKDSKYIKQFSITELTISSSQTQTNIVLDGETLKLQSPLHFVCQKNKLKVISV